MTVYFPLRLRILVFTVLPLLSLTAAALWTVNRGISRQARTSIHDNLVRSSIVFEEMLAARASRLELAAQVIVADPRFASILAISGSSSGPQYRATVKKVASDFNSITTTDLFEVLDARGHLLASCGRATSSAAARASLVSAAMHGRQVSGILVEDHRHFQVTVTPVSVNRRVVGALLLGAGIAQPLALELKWITHSEVTFASRNAITGSSFASAGERTAVLAALSASAASESRKQDGQQPAGAAGRLSAAGPDSPAVPAPWVVVGASGASQKYLTLIGRIPHSEPQAQQVYVMQRSLDAETAFLREIQAGLLRLGGVAAAVALLAGFIVSASITRPVRRLVRGAEEMERGNYDFPLGSAGQDEIGYLSKRFQEMRQHERTYVSSLQEAARIKSEFISVASHELRTPISVIKAYHALLSTGDLGPVSPEQAKAFAAIDKNVERLVGLAEDSARMAEIEGGRPSLNRARHEVAELIETALSIGMTGAHERKVEIACEVEPGLGSVSVDRDRMARAIADLIRNGIRFTPDGGHVRAKARRDQDELVIEVRDDGIGIPQDKQCDLFNRPFMLHDSLNHHSSSTLEFNSAGLGLGLPIARGIVEAHGGKLLVESWPGKGSTFTIRLPLTDDEGLQAAA